MKLEQIKGNTYVIEGSQYIGLYKTRPNACILFDPGSAKLRDDLEALLQKEGLQVAGVACTHMHYDHHENSSYFHQRYNAPIMMPHGEAEIVHSYRSLKNHLFCFPMGLIRHTARLKNLICDVQNPILGEEDCAASLGEAELHVLRTPGHSPDHCCYVTHDGVCFGGDVLMTESMLENAKIPFVFDMAEDLDSKEWMKTTSYHTYIFSHRGVVTGSVAELAQKNIDLMKKQLEVCTRLVTQPMTYSGFYQAVIRELDMTQGHPVIALHLERYLRPYLEYLIDTDRLTLCQIQGAPGVAPGGERG